MSVLKGQLQIFCCGDLRKQKKRGDSGGSGDYRNLAQGICSDFRKLLERTVEDVLLNGVVKRHRRSVTTDNRLLALSFIEAKDCEFIDKLMTKYSCYEHSQSQELPVRIPEEQELREDIAILIQWHECFTARKKTDGESIAKTNLSLV